MNRPPQPEKKEKLLAQCLDAVTASGTLDFSINALAKSVNTSGRMLVYHFGSKLALQKELITLLETRLRQEMHGMQRSAPQTEAGMAQSIIAFWDHLTQPNMRGLLVLWIALVQRATTDEETQVFFREENHKWLDFLEAMTQDRAKAQALYHLILGALLDFLATGDPQPGADSLQIFVGG